MHPGPYVYKPPRPYMAMHIITYICTTQIAYSGGVQPACNEQMGVFYCIIKWKGSPSIFQPC